MLDVIEAVNRIVWGAPALVAILGVGVYLSAKTGFAQIKLFPRAVRMFFQQFQKKHISDGVSPYQALCTALAATVGTGNIAGVAGAISIGGPGAVFWMWICAILGMVTKFAEATLSVRYRKKNTLGEYVGGPMYMIQAMKPKWRWLAIAYCFFGVVAAFGIGNATQINAVIVGINSIVVYLGGASSQFLDIAIGVILAIILIVMLIGGARRIGAIAVKLVPYAAVGYILLCCIVLIGRLQWIPYAFRMIIVSAFSPKALTGGMVGSAFTALRIGASRGVFTNEAGMGTASIAHAASTVKHPVEQGLMGIIEVFLDTIVICTMTALVILCSGVTIQYGYDTGSVLTTQAFSSVLGEWVCIPITVFLCCFAIATILGWGLYGIRCVQFLFGESKWKTFVYLQAITAILSAVLRTGTIWMLAETVNGLMAIPNLVVLAYMTPELRRLTLQYKVLKEQKY